jgi:predicted nucleic acid-binding protein
MNRSIVVYDSSVLYPAPLRDLLMHLALTNLFKARWTETIHEEWMRNVLKNRPDLSRERLERTRQRMDRNVPDALVTRYKGLIPSLKLPDPDDRHVLAAAIRAKADTIVTMNLRHFPKASLEPFEMKAQHPDDFAMRLVGMNASTVFQAIMEQQQSLKKPAKTMKEFLETLERQGLKKVTAWLRNASQS